MNEDDEVLASPSPGIETEVTADGDTFPVIVDDQPRQVTSPARRVSSGGDLSLLLDSEGSEGEQVVDELSASAQGDDDSGAELVYGRPRHVWEEIRENVPFNRNYVHPMEEEAMQQLLARHPVAHEAFFSRKFLWACLFARKLDVTRTAELLANNLAWRREHNYLRRLRVSDVGEAIMTSGYTWAKPGMRDRDGRSVTYIKMARFVPKLYSHEMVFDHFVWSFDHYIEQETLDVFREGITYVEDIAGVGFSNMDNGLSKKLMHNIQNNFPVLIRKIYIVNSGFLIRALIGIARLFMKKKIIDRVACITHEQLAEHVDPDQLSVEFGGRLDYNWRDFLEAMRAKEDE